MSNSGRSALLKIFPEKFRVYRESQNLTREGMAEHLRISARSYYDLEHGNHMCSCMVLLRFLDGLEDPEVQCCLVRLAVSAMDQDQDKEQDGDQDPGEDEDKDETHPV